MEAQVIEGARLRCLLSVPAALGPHPVLCFLHGYDEAAPMDIRRAVTMHGPLRAGNPAVAGEFIIVAPQLPRAGDLWHRHADDVGRIVDEVRERHGGDARRSYLTGFSFGGNGVFDLAIAQPHRWAALWPVDPTRVPVRDPGRPVWLSFGEVARYRKAGFTGALGLQSVGDPPEGDRLGLDEGEDHVGSARRAYRDERIYRWLLARSLPDQDR